MKPHEIQVAVRRSGLAPIYVILGEEDYLRGRALENIRHVVLGCDPGRHAILTEGAIPSKTDSFIEHILYGDETDASEIMACLQAVSIFSTHSFVVLKWGEKLSSRHGDNLIPYFQNPSGSSTFVIIAGKLDGRVKWVQALKRSATVVDCAPLYENQHLSWVKQEASRLGLHLSLEAAQLLKELAGEGLGVVRQEFDKLACFLQPGTQVEPTHVEALRGMDPGASVFDLADAIGSADTGLAFLILRKNLDAGEAPLRILGSLLWQYRRIWKTVHRLANGGNEGTVARSLGISPFKQREFFLTIRKFSEAHLQRAFRLFLETDAALKGSVGSTPRQVIETLVLSLCSTTLVLLNQTLHDRQRLDA